ncbi:MAG: DUF58 domain-containing protein [Planctomycetota bacterium]|nr:DUF58 domain-containing protein [Planctomycetota bacterium]
MAEPKNLLDPKRLARVSKMEIVARQVVEGFVSGRHPSPYFGSSVEYADHRPYTIGDEIRTIDWKLLAKTDKHYIKLFEEQTNLRCTILLDTSKSMSTGTEITKAHYGSHLAAALAYLMLGQNDAVGLALFDSQVREFLPARTTASHFRRMVDLMEHITPRADTGIGAVLHEMAGRTKRRGMVILISDLLDDIDAITDGLAHFRYNRHEVIVFHVMDRAELTFPFDRLTRFKDMEGHAAVIANPRSVREKYIERLEAFLAKIKRNCLERGVSYQFAPTDTPYDQMLLAYLEQRQRMARFG